MEAIWQQSHRQSVASAASTAVQMEGGAVSKSTSKLESRIVEHTVLSFKQVSGAFPSELCWLSMKLALPTGAQSAVPFI